MSDQPDVQVLDIEEGRPDEGPTVSPPTSDTPVENVSSSDDTPTGASSKAKEEVKAASRKAPSSARRRRKRMPTVSLEELQPGTELTGIVRNIQPFGAFVDIGAETDGLVHISELRDDFVEKVEDVVQVGDVVTVRVKEVDAERGRISLTMRSPESASEPRRKRLPLDAIEEGQEYTGIVTSVVKFGAFVDIGAVTDGLVHISELSDARVNRVEDVVEVGQEVTVRVLSVDPARKRISLTMRNEPDATDLPHFAEEEEERESPVTPFALAFARAAQEQKQKERKKRDQQQKEDESPMMDIIRRTLEQLQSSES